MNKNKFQPVVAFLSLEIALENQMRTYAGGLGVLAGDLLRSAADVGFPMIGVTLVNRQGYLKQTIVAGRQVAGADKWYPERLLKRLNKTVDIEIGRDKVRVGAWQYTIETGKIKIPVLLLDTDLPENKTAYRRLTDNLYAAGQDIRLQQEIILGRGGVRIIKALGHNKINKYHLNEGHASLAALELIKQARQNGFASKLKAVRDKCVFTTHTPLLGAQDIFRCDFFKTYVPDWPDNLESLFEEGKINLTKVGLHLSGSVNAVSKKHREVSRLMFPGKTISSITNGVNPSFWTGPEMAKIFDSQAPGWRRDSRLLVDTSKIDPAYISEAHSAAKRRLVKHVNRIARAGFQDNVFTTGFARRFTEYKRPLLLLSDLKRLRRLAKDNGGLQIIFSGKSHPSDSYGQELIARLHRIIESNDGFLRIVYLPGYDMDLARLLVSGSDLWLNNPEPPLEASGTSGMKAAFNGVPQLSTADGWWPEGRLEGKTGWTIREYKGGNNLLDILENNILPLYKNDLLGWRQVMISTIVGNAARFGSDRMLREYITKAYKIKKPAW